MLLTQTLDPVQANLKTINGRQFRLDLLWTIGAPASLMGCLNGNGDTFVFLLAAGWFSAFQALYPLRDRSNAWHRIAILYRWCDRSFLY